MRFTYIAIPLLALSACFGSARAQEVYEPPATASIQNPYARDAARGEQAAAQALAGRRQKMIEHCEDEHGIDCEREVDTELRAEALQWGARVIHVRPAR